MNNHPQITLITQIPLEKTTEADGSKVNLRSKLTTSRPFEHDVIYSIS
jgi:hypothetical protein